MCTDKSHPAVGVAVVNVNVNITVELLKFGTIGQCDNFSSIVGLGLAHRMLDRVGRTKVLFEAMFRAGHLSSSL